MEYTTAKQLFESDIPEPTWLVNDIIPTNGIVLFAGEQACSKSLMALHIAMCVASGTPVLGIVPVKKGRVLYIDEENRDIQIKDRYVRMIKGNSLEYDLDIDFMIIKNIKLDERNRIIEDYIKERAPTLIICDSMVRMMTGDEDKAKDVRKVFDNIKMHDTAWLMLHHTSKTGNNIKSIRGSGDWVNMCDDVFMFKKGKGKHSFAFHQEKARGATWIKGYEYQFTGDQYDPITINYTGEKGITPLSRDFAKDTIEVWLKTQDTFKTGAITEELAIPKHIAREALELLLIEKKIKSVGRGLWKNILSLS